LFIACSIFLWASFPGLNHFMFIDFITKVGLVFITLPSLVFLNHLLLKLGMIALNLIRRLIILLLNWFILFTNIWLIAINVFILLSLMNILLILMIKWFLCWLIVLLFSICRSLVELSFGIELRIVALSWFICLVITWIILVLFIVRFRIFLKFIFC
jgi:hypothetical protein